MPCREKPSCETGTVYLGWQGEYTKFTNVEVKYSHQNQDNG